MKTLEGNLVSKEIRVGIVVARFNEFITSKLLGGAMDGLLRHNVADDDIHVAGCRVHLKFHWLLLRWQKAENTMLLFVWERSFVEQQAIMIMFVTRCQRVLLLFRWKMIFRLCSAC